MADIGQQLLASLLLGAEKDAIATSPFAPISGAADLVGKTLIQASPNYDLKDNLLAGLITGLVGGGSDYLSQQYANKQTGLLNDLVQGQAANPGSIFEKPEGLDSSLFNKAEAVQSIFDIENRQDIAQQARASSAALTNEILKSGLDNPEKTRRNLTVLGLRKGDATTTPGAQTPGIDPKSYDALAQKYRGNEALIEAELKQQIESPDRNKATEDALRTQLLGQKAIQNFTEISKQYAVLQQAYADPTAVSDLDYTFGVMKILDPDSIVRESEQGQIIQSQAIPSALLGQMNKVIQGKAVLDPTLRKSMLDLAGRRYEIQKGIAETLSKEFERMATERGASAANVGIIPQASVLERQSNAVQMPQGNAIIPPNAPPGARPTGRTAGGKPVYQVGENFWVPD